MGSMIWRLLQNLVWVMLLACGLAACAQVDPTTRLASLANNGSANSRVGISQASTSVRLFGSNAQQASIIAPAGANPTVSVGGGSLWNHLRGNFQLPPYANNPEVQAQIEWYARHQQYFDRIISRAAPYMYFIMEQAQQRNLPAELVLLPIMESAYNPFANSNRGAAGLWQLMHTTAYGYGVRQDWWYDGRRDIYASTNAALDYLTYLQSYFGGDWLLAMAAYNAGEGTIQVAMRRNARAGQPMDFWSLHLPRETQSYVPRLLALACIISNPGRYNITLPPIMDRPYLEQVDLGAPINLSQAAQLANMNLNDLKQLNPGYSHMMTDPNGPYKLLLPIDRIPTFKENLAISPGLSRTTWSRYKVQKGDTLASIAKKYKTTVAELVAFNQFKKKKAPVGKVVMIPTGTDYVKPHLEENSNSPIQLAAPANRMHVTASPVQTSANGMLAMADTDSQSQQPKALKADENPNKIVSTPLQPSHKVIIVSKRSSGAKHRVASKKSTTHVASHKATTQVAKTKHSATKTRLATASKKPAKG